MTAAASASTACQESGFEGRVWIRRSRGSSSSSMSLAGLQGLSDCEGTYCILPQLSSPDGPHICLPQIGYRPLSAFHGSIRAGDAAASQEH